MNATARRAQARQMGNPGGRCHMPNCRCVWWACGHPARYLWSIDDMHSIDLPSHAITSPVSDPRSYEDLLAASCGYMFFYMTAKQLVAGTKDVTRRLGWRNLEPGDLVTACKKCRYTGRGDVYGVIRTVRVGWERLNSITPADVKREGFPEMSCDAFIIHFCKTMKCTPDYLVNRIEFEFTPAPSRQLGLF